MSSHCRLLNNFYFNFANSLPISTSRRCHFLLQGATHEGTPRLQVSPQEETKVPHEEGTQIRILTVAASVVWNGAPSWHTAVTASSLTSASPWPTSTPSPSSDRRIRLKIPAVFIPTLSISPLPPSSRSKAACGRPGFDFRRWQDSGRPCIPGAVRQFSVLARGSGCSCGNLAEQHRSGWALYGSVQLRAHHSGHNRD